MRLTMDRSHKKVFGLFGKLEYIDFTVQLTEEEKHIIQSKGIGNRIFLDCPKHPEGTGNAGRPTIYVRQLLRGTTFSIYPVGFDEISFKALEEQVQDAARSLKEMIDTVAQPSGKKVLEL